MPNAEVISVLPHKIRIKVDDIDDFRVAEEKFAVGSYLRVSDSQDCAIIAMIENFVIEQIEASSEKKYVLEAVPIGFLDSTGKFMRGGNNIAIPPTGVEPAKKEEVRKIYNQIEDVKKFNFARLLQNEDILVPVDGDKFFNKHIAIIGSTGSGKSHTVAKILQEAKVAKENNYGGLNNSHIFIFDIHSEYKNAFPCCNYIDVSTLHLPYWLMNGEELEEIFVETGENQAYNQINLLRRLITRNKQIKNPDEEDVSFDTPVTFSMQEILTSIVNLSKETRNSKNSDEIMIRDAKKEFNNDEEKFDSYFTKLYEFNEQKNGSVSKGTYNDGSLEKFISRIRNKLNDKRLEFLFGAGSINMKFSDVLTELLGYKSENNSNVTIIDLSDVPFEVLSITVSLISRLMFECGYYLKQLNGKDCVAPLLLVYEEAHKYVPKLKDTKYNSSRISIERIAKEGRKYGVTLAIVSQRPSEISETIFSQCSNFVVMRLTNPQDQGYAKRLLPDSLGTITDTLPSLESGEAILIGDSVVMPSIIKVERCSPEPESNDINYLQEWKRLWRDLDFEPIVKRYKK
ncbi:ATP-binding protein [Clostridium botulinum]|uniref:ATP-binding protein n=1 Tax=Clostridium botulinum TaxID=1491 RepID=UPI000773FD71|nr:ATP-binding protein [Clostridium botulinum]MBY6951337.1 ATP-binding protein [Clostridium botulinum]MCR1138915.1 ATP-binding protein [Clostridium botulinum]NEZ78717.1 ATP-binding protein [Clostridium botulinum]NFA16423.1 ATP-binding protein [Clostridium botulinum]NFA51818.1 ATP-binding protein [Clostridium botulinum]